MHRMSAAFEVDSVEELALLVVTDENRRDNAALAADVCRAAGRAGVPILNLVHATSRSAIAVGVSRSRHRRMSQELTRGDRVHGARRVETIEPVASLSLRGPLMTGSPGYAARFFVALAESGIDVLAAAQSAAETNMTCYVHAGDLTHAVRALRAEFAATMSADGR
jgi:bifunctional aspartokinase / homoserine dehydrogenase 1